MLAGTRPRRTKMKTPARRTKLLKRQMWTRIQAGTRQRRKRRLKRQRRMKTPARRTRLLKGQTRTGLLSRISLRR